MTTTNASGLSLYTLIGNGAGAFAPGVTKAITATNAGANPPLVLAGQLTSATDNNTILGITTKSATTTGTATGDVAVFLGNGNDTFGSEMDTTYNSEAAAMLTGDFNNDDALDVVVGGPVTTDSGGNPASARSSISRGRTTAHSTHPCRSTRRSSGLLRRRRAHQRQEPGPGGGQRRNAIRHHAGRRFDALLSATAMEHSSRPRR